MGDIMQDFCEYVNALKRKIKFSKEETVFVCIGSKDIIWDSIGPYVGSLLKRRIGSEYVIGDLENNICSSKDLKIYYPRLKNKFIVAIDSAVSEENLHGQIFVTEEPIIMGLGIRKNKGKVGNVGIKVGVEIEKNIDRNILDISNIVVEGICCWYSM